MCLNIASGLSKDSSYQSSSGLITNTTMSLRASSPVWEFVLPCSAFGEVRVMK